MARSAGRESHGEHVSVRQHTGNLHGGGQHSSRRCTRRRMGGGTTWYRQTWHGCYSQQLGLGGRLGLATQQSRHSSMPTARARSSYARETSAIQPCARLASCPGRRQPRLGLQPMTVAVARALLALFVAAPRYYCYYRTPSAPVRRRLRPRTLVPHYHVHCSRRRRASWASHDLQDITWRCLTRVPGTLMYEVDVLSCHPLCSHRHDGQDGPIPLGLQSSWSYRAVGAPAACLSYYSTRDASI